MRQMASKNQHISPIQRDGHPGLCILPGLCDVAAVLQLNVHFVRAGDDFQTAVFWGGGVNGEVCCDVVYAADVIVGGGIKVGLEAVPEGKLIVDFVFKEEHFLTRSGLGWLCID